VRNKGGVVNASHGEVECLAGARFGEKWSSRKYGGGRVNIEKGRCYGRRKGYHQKGRSLQAPEIAIHAWGKMGTPRACKMKRWGGGSARQAEKREEANTVVEA